MSKRHRWVRRTFSAVCANCLMRRRWLGCVRIESERFIFGHWEYLPANVSGWEHAQRTCGPCPGRGA